MKFPMCTAVASQVEGDNMTSAKVKSVGLVDAHAYSLIGAKLITLDNGKTERLIQIRNPWGKKEWQGAWGDKSKKWTESTMRQVNLQDKDDGLFWIAFSDYVNFFYITTICYFYEHLKDNSVADQHELGNFGMTKFTIDEDVTDPVIVSVDQANARFVDETMRGTYEYPSIRLMLTKIKEVTNPKTQVVAKQ